MVSKQNDGSRHVGADLLRIIAMMMVVSLHISGYTGVLKSNENSLQYFIAWCLESLSFVAVNCFVLISSYFLLDSKFNKKKLFSLWFQVFCFTVTGYILLLLTGVVNFSAIALVRCIFPFLSKAYWFITAYVCLYLLFPYLNIFIKSMSDSDLKKITIILLALFSVIPTFFYFSIGVTQTMDMG